MNWPGLNRRLRVVEFASVLAAPSVGMFFAELGADIIKIEEPRRGDITRVWALPTEKSDSTVTSYFSAINWGKRSVCLNLLDPLDRRIAHELVRQADMVLESWKHGDAERFGVTEDILRELNPGVVIGRITGYGAESSRTAFDAILQAESGFMHLNRTPDMPPAKMPVALIDVLAAHQLKEGLLFALLQKATAGETIGKTVSVSLADTAVVSLVNQAASYLYAGSEPVPMGSDHPTIVPYGSLFLCGDGRYIVLAVGNDEQFRRLCDVLGCTELAVDARFATNKQRVVNKADLLERLRRIFEQQQHSDTLLNMLMEQKVPAGKVNTVSEALAGAQREQLYLESVGGRGIRSVVWPASVSLAPPPELGEHTQQVTSALEGGDSPWVS